MRAGMSASNGVNGAAATAEHPASGIQGDFRLSLFQARRPQGRCSTQQRRRLLLCGGPRWQGIS